MSRSAGVSAHEVVVFLHVVGALGLFAGIALEQAGLAGLRRARTVAQIREWMVVLGALRRIDAPSSALLLVTGVYLAVSRWEHQAWIAAGLFGLVTMAAVGIGAGRRRIAAIARALPAGDGPVGAALAALVHDRALRTSGSVRAAVGITVVFEMTVKPVAMVAVVAMIAAIAAGIVIGAVAGRRGAKAASPAGAESWPGGVP